MAQVLVVEEDARNWVDLRPGEIDARKLPLRQRKAFGWPLWDSRDTRQALRTKLAVLLGVPLETEPAENDPRTLRKELAGLPGPAAYPTWSWVRIRSGMADYNDSGGALGWPPAWRARRHRPRRHLVQGGGVYREALRPRGPVSRHEAERRRRCKRCERPGDGQIKFQEVAAFAGRMSASGRRMVYQAVDDRVKRRWASEVRRVLKAMQAPPLTRGRPPERTTAGRPRIERLVER